MKSLSSVGLGLSVVFGCLFLALIAELYYLLWWKKRFTNREIENDYSSPQKELFYTFCWRRNSSLCHTARGPRELCASLRMTETLVHDPNSQLHIHTSNNLLLKQLEEDELDAELMRLQNAAGPPRHLFTIVEETKEDLESEDGKSKGDRSQKGSRKFNRLRSSPPPKFKFLQVAEEKLRIKLKEEAEKGVHKIDGQVQEKGNKAPPISRFLKDEEDGSFITIIVDKNKERELNHHHLQLPQYHSSTSQVLPLASSPSAFRSTINKKPTLH
ncbi:uncharacterized protein Pyn_37695 [Prunus yedoensis var. nudiflora]|uniref:Uncharacterized protein n=1 Tax=Prunus yedoensis var. nudiflora TaxID=2094558 RepID=A0A314ZNQ8_PRUYE|nr:uncharacterized protein Pyn_37695 [Prunus yedoensis var. nudiflora]